MTFSTGPERLETIFADYDIETVIHLAAKNGIRNSIEDPSRYIDVNVNGTNKMQGLSVANRVNIFVYASSSSAYGDRGEVLLHEYDRTDKPVSPYAASKKVGEVLTYSYHSLYDIPVSYLRFFTAYGRTCLHSSS